MSPSLLHAVRHAPVRQPAPSSPQRKDRVEGDRPRFDEALRERRDAPTAKPASGERPAAEAADKPASPPSPEAEQATPEAIADQPQDTPVAAEQTIVSGPPADALFDAAADGEVPEVVTAMVGQSAVAKQPQAATPAPAVGINRAAAIDDAVAPGVAAAAGTVVAEAPELSVDAMLAASAVDGEALPQQAPTVPTVDAAAADEAAPVTANRPRVAQPAATAEAKPADAPVAAMRPMEASTDTAQAAKATPDAAAETVAAMRPAEAAPKPSAPTATMPTPIVDDGGPMGDDNAASVRRAVTTSASGRGQTVTVRLDPPSLGSIRVQVRISGGETIASIGTSSDVAHGLVKNSVDQLRAGLERAGVTVDRINVTRMGPVGAAESSAESRNDAQQQGGDNRSTGREQADQQQRDQARRDAILRRWRLAA